MRAFRTLALAAIAILAISAPANAITFGQLDGNGHPNVGAMVLLDENGDPGLVCSGTLISPTVFLTASHCTAFLPEIGVDAHDVYVTFDPVVGPGATLYRGTAHTNPLYGGPESDPHDVAVIVLDEAPAGRRQGSRRPTCRLRTCSTSSTSRASGSSRSATALPATTRRKAPRRSSSTPRDARSTRASAR